jgi:hypothetical protein
MQRMPLSTPRTVLRSWCALLAGLCLLAAAHATADGPDFYRASGLSPGSSMPLRPAPQADAPAVGRIRADATCLRNLGCQGGLSLEEYSRLSEPARQQRLAENPRWCQVLYQGRSGWVPGRNLAESVTACAGSRDKLALAGTGAVVRRGRIRGDGFADHIVQGRAGQRLSVSLKGSHPQNYANPTPPGSSWPLFVGSTSGQQTAGTPFHAQATVVCRQASAAGQTGAFSASVIRYQRPGSATVEPRWSEAGVPRVRRLLFVDGRAVDSDAVDMPRTQGPGDPCCIDLVADEPHEFPHALVSGG